MTDRKIEETNSDRMVKKNRAPVKQPERAGTGPESQTYQQRTGLYIERDEANKRIGAADKDKKTASQKK